MRKEYLKSKRKNEQVLFFDSINQRLVERQKKVFGMSTKICDLRGKTATQLLTEVSQGRSAPIDLSPILRKYDISALPMDFSKIEELDGIAQFVAERGKILGILFSTNEKAAIFYNKDDRRDGHRCRFTIAHELAHCCLTGAGAHIEFRLDSRNPDPLEYKANVFAGELLIPTNLLHSILSELLFPTLAVLADIFAVSENVMFERLKYLDIKKRIIGYNC